MNEQKKYVSLQEGFEIFMSNPENKVVFDSMDRNRKLESFTSSIQPGIIWKPYNGDRRCMKCSETSDYSATRGCSIVGYYCKKCHLTIKF